MNVSSIAYVELAFVMFGMLVFAWIGEDIGRRLHSRTTIALMLLGGILMTAASSPTNLYFLFIMFQVGLVIFALGVGGEYSAASSTSSEDAEYMWPKKRGRSVGLTFSLQGWGNFANTLIIFIFVLGLGTDGCVPKVDGPGASRANCQASGLEWSWRGSYLVGIVFVLGAMIYRYTLLRDSTLWLERKDEIEHLSKREARRQRRRMNKSFFFDAFNFSRLAGCSLNWFLHDVAFYSNKLFQTSTIAVTLGSKPTLNDIYSATLINSSVAIAGYYCMALSIDYTGRRNLQALGFAVTSVLYLTCAFNYTALTMPASIDAFRAIYYLSSFFSQFGPNGTTFILPAELFATDVRPFAHGISASWGKLGALLATIVYSLGGNGGGPVSVQTIFLVNGFVCLAGLVCTLLLTPDTTNVTLHEVDMLWKSKLLRAEYVGSALATNNLSFVERMWLVPHSAQRESNEHVGNQVPGEILSSTITPLGEDEEDEDDDKQDGKDMHGTQVAIV